MTEFNNEVASLLYLSGRLRAELGMSAEQVKEDILNNLPKRTRTEPMDPKVKESFDELIEEEVRFAVSSGCDEDFARKVLTAHAYASHDAVMDNMDRFVIGSIPPDIPDGMVVRYNDPKDSLVVMTEFGDPHPPIKIEREVPEE